MEDRGFENLRLAIIFREFPNKTPLTKTIVLGLCLKKISTPKKNHRFPAHGLVVFLAKKNHQGKQQME